MQKTHNEDEILNGENSIIKINNLLLEKNEKEKLSLIDLSEKNNLNNNGNYNVIKHETNIVNLNENKKNKIGNNKYNPKSAALKKLIDKIKKDEASNNNSNNYDSINYIQKINNKPKIPEHVLKRNQKYQSSSLEAKHSLKKGRNFVKSAAEMYEAGVYGRKYLMRNLLYFHSYFFDKNKKNKWKRLNPVFKVDNQLNSDKINLPDSLSKKIDFDGLYRDKYGSSSNFNKSRNRKRIPNDKNNLTYKEIRDLSLQGYKRMKAYKIRQLNLRLKNTNDEVLDLEHKLDELLEVNKKMFLIAE